MPERRRRAPRSRWPKAQPQGELLLTRFTCTRGSSKQIHPDTGISPKAMGIVNSFSTTPWRARRRAWHITASARSSPPGRSRRPRACCYPRRRPRTPCPRAPRPLSSTSAPSELLAAERWVTPGPHPTFWSHPCVPRKRLFTVNPTCLLKVCDHFHH